MRDGIGLRGLFTLIVIAAVAVAGVYVYNMGVEQGLAAPRGDGAPVTPYVAPMFYPRFGGGFGFFCLPLLFLFFLFPLFGVWRRGWHGRWHRGDRGAGWEKGVPPMFEEWHRRAHGQSSEPPAAKDS